MAENSKIDRPGAIAETAITPELRGLERYRPSINGDVLHSWAADAQAEIDRLRTEVQRLGGQV